MIDLEKLINERIEWIKKNTNSPVKEIRISEAHVIRSLIYLEEDKNKEE